MNVLFFCFIWPLLNHNLSSWNFVTCDLSTGIPSIYLNNQSTSQSSSSFPKIEWPSFAFIVIFIIYGSGLHLTARSDNSNMLQECGNCTWTQNVVQKDLQILKKHFKTVKTSQKTILMPKHFQLCHILTNSISRDVA